jgi:hypothetical protein
MSDCYYDEAGCLVCPEQAAQDYLPPSIENRAVVGWNAGANSLVMLDGDLRAKFDMPLGEIGTIIGLKGDRAKPTNPALIEHGWYFQKGGSTDLVQPIERGVTIGSPITGRTADTVFEIRRIQGLVSYWKDGVKVYTSALPSAGVKVVNCCLYASGDTVPSGLPITTVIDTLVDFAAGSAGLSDDPYWFVDVVAGKSNITFMVVPPVGDPSSISMVVNFGTRPVGMWPMDTTGFTGYTYLGAASPPPEPNAGPIDLTLSYDAPAVGRWYVALDPSAVGAGYRLLVTVT